MPKQNRVTPFSTLIATPARGSLMGNRGCLHNDRQEIRRSFQGSRWIICLLEFKGRRRPIMKPGQYTELFFLDEATALAAGHRPCAECQRERFNLFRESWARANPGLSGGAARPAATVLDAVLQGERTGADGKTWCDSLDDLPDGVFVTDDEQNAYLVLSHQALRWSPAGYEQPETGRPHYPARVLTPASVLRALTDGYLAGVHASAYLIMGLKPP
jgi:hypothetical protein